MSGRRLQGVVFGLLACTLLQWSLNVQAWGQFPGLQQSAPAPLEPPDVPGFDPNDMLGGARAASMLNISTNYSGRAAVTFDSTRLADFAAGSFMPAAIPVLGDPFYGSGERAMVQGNGSAIQVKAQPVISTGFLAAEAILIADSFSSLDQFSASTRAHVQYNQLVVGSTETAFADPTCLVPILDLAGPGARATILSPVGAGGQGRLSYFLDPNPDSPEGILGNISIESPIPEIRLPAVGVFGTSSHFPDFIATLRLNGGYWYLDENKKETFEETHHVQLGVVLRDIGLKSGDNVIDESQLGWGIQISGATEVPIQTCGGLRDAIGFSATAGQGIGHYIHDLHVIATGQKTGGNDAIWNGNTLELLPAQAFYAGYVHHWDDYWQTTVAYSLVNVDPVVGQSADAYHRGQYAVINIVFVQDVEVTVPANAPKSPIKYFVAGIEYLYGQKEAFDGDQGHAHRLAFVVNISK